MDKMEKHELVTDIIELMIEDLVTQNSEDLQKAVAEGIAVRVDNIFYDELFHESDVDWVTESQLEMCVNRREAAISKLKKALYIIRNM